MESTSAETPPSGSHDQQAPAWHSLPTEDALRALDSEAESGLSTTEAAARLARHGRNALPETTGRGIARMVLDQFSDFMIPVLIAAAIVSGLVGEPADTIAILVIVLLSAAIGVAKEWRAERAMAALRRMAAPVARVRRGGIMSSSVEN